ncbi:gliding motility-associated C-terminal domain-containing protein [Prolixibacteraceae bacterium Z1-6]|uniref:Gliding motility-associated C-terminal domain-containing protein n=1 Tax=Draconibacterium aestuarii TaxID=2998507 RepID=A0A9X3F573_9BACT|nr:gliding motility-associated C-terminal domain-containing protein [Prolixibacteraceae bacterium Z1-6]
MKKYFKIVFVIILCYWAQTALGQDTIPLNTSYSFEVNFVEGYTYFWWFTNEKVESTPLFSTTNSTEEYLWDTPGDFQIQCQAKDKNGCLSEVISKAFVVVDVDQQIFVSAGRDTTIGTCLPYRLQATVSDSAGITYLWEPADQLDDPTILNPMFTPGSTTTFVLTVTSPKGISVQDSVTISVSEIVAEAGDIVMEKGTAAMLDGTASLGKDIQFLWTTSDGNIVSDDTGGNPVVNSAGTYYLEVTDSYGCVATDSVSVSWVIYAPVATDDYDTTTLQTEVTIPVLTNDYNPGGDLDPSSLSIQQYPVNGSVYINYEDYTVTYVPESGFTGSDVFEYRVCNLYELCDNAHVYVLVTHLDFFIPQAFTPNGDGVNDSFEIIGIETYEGNSLTVINRWGKKVYEAQNYGISTTPKFWDGKWTTGGGNEDLPTGTYFYVLDLRNGQKPIAGSVYIDR